MRIVSCVPPRLNSILKLFQTFMIVYRKLYLDNVVGQLYEFYVQLPFLCYSLEFRISQLLVLLNIFHEKKLNFR